MICILYNNLNLGSTPQYPMKKIDRIPLTAWIYLSIALLTILDAFVAWNGLAAFP